MARTVEQIEASELVAMVVERLSAYSNDELQAFWERNFGPEPKVWVDETGELILE